MNQIFVSNTISYDELKPLSLNPRFVDITKLDLTKLDEIDYNLQEVCRKTLDFEGDFFDFRELVEELNNGFNPALDQIFAIKTKKDKIYTLEGNRRSIAMHFLKNAKLAKEILNKIANDNKNNKVIEKNINDILKICENCKTDFSNIPVMIYDVNATEISSEVVDEIWKIIFTRHAGENKGKKGWYRALYFQDLAKIYASYKEKGLKEKEVISKLSQLFNKSTSTIQLDLVHSLIVLKLFELAGQNIISRNNHKKFYSHISSLELSFDTIKLKLDDGSEQSIKKLFEIKWNKEKWTISFGKIDGASLSKFLLDSVQKQYFNTRGWENEHYHLLMDFVKTNIKDKTIKVANFKTIKTLISDAENKKPSKRSAIEKSLINFDSNTKAVASQIKLLKTKDLVDHSDVVSNSIVELWNNNIQPIFSLFRDRETKAYPFLIGATIIRSIEELVCTFLFVYNDWWRSHILELIRNKKQKDIDEEILLNKCKDFTSTYNYVVLKGKNGYIYAVYKKIIQDFYPGNKIYKQITNSIQNPTNWTKKWKVLSNSKNLKIWLAFISKHASSQKNNSKINEVIHKYYLVSNADSNKLSKYFDIISDLLVEISNLIGTLFK